MHMQFMGCAAVCLLLAGASLLPSARSYAEAALHSPQHRLRRLGCEQLGRLMLAAADEQQQQQLESILMAALQVTAGFAG
jgi:hypothetical protein